MSKILTESNIKKLQEELDYRMTVRRAEIAKEKLIAAAHEIDGKIYRYLAIGVYEAWCDG